MASFPSIVELLAAGRANCWHCLPQGTGRSGAVAAGVAEANEGASCPQHDGMIFLVAGASPPGFGLGVEISCRVYKPRRSRESPLYWLVEQHLEELPSRRALAYDKPLCASLDGFTLHAATRAGALDSGGREALLRYVLRPPVAQERVEQRPDGLVRITLKKAYRDGTIAVDMDPLSLLCRLATSVPPPRFHTVKYAGVLAPAATASAEPGRPDHPRGYRPWAAFGAYLRRGRARLSHLPGADEAARAGQRSGEHRPLPRHGGRGDRAASALARSRSAVLEEPRATPQAARRRG